VICGRHEPLLKHGGGKPPVGEMRIRRAFFRLMYNLKFLPCLRAQFVFFYSRFPVRLREGCIERRASRSIVPAQSKPGDATQATEFFAASAALQTAVQQTRDCRCSARCVTVIATRDSYVRPIIVCRRGLAMGGLCVPFLVLSFCLHRIGFQY